MTYDRWPLVGLIALSTLCAIILSFFAWRHRKRWLGTEFFVLVTLVAIYSFGYMFELASDSLASIRFWLRIESVGIAFLPAAWIMLAVRHSRLRGRYWPGLVSVLALFSAITFVLSNTSEFHNLYYRQLTLHPMAPFPVVVISKGAWYWVHTGYVHLAILFGNCLYARSWMKGLGAQSQQAFTLFLASLFPWFGFIIYLAGLTPWGIDPMSLAFLVTCVLLVWAIFGLNMLDAAPIARAEIFHRLSEGVLVFNEEGVLTDFNASSRRVFPQLTADSQGMMGGEVFTGYPDLTTMINDKVVEQKTIGIISDGQMVSYEVQGTELYEQEKHRVGYMLTIRDITRFSTTIEGLQLRAAIDPLTEAWNRNRWYADGMAAVASAKAANQSLAVIIVDIDNFKQINDQYGHLTGDSVLREFARVCKENLRNYDIFGRFGGDEFVIALPGRDLPSAGEVAERLRKLIATNPVFTGEGPIQITASFGVASTDEIKSPELEDLIKAADTALYQSKRMGRNRVSLTRE